MHGRLHGPISTLRGRPVRDFPPENQASREPSLPSGYAEGSAIFAEMERTITVLGDLSELVDENVHQRRRVEKEIRLEPPYFILGDPVLDGALNHFIDRETAEHIDHVSRQYTLTINIIRKVSPILKGYIEHVETVRIKQYPFVTYFIAVHGLRDKLDRDHHGVVGWHYHYCDKKGRRSDTMLSFDTKQQLQVKTVDAVALSSNPLFWERHSESNAKFSARAELWGVGKRESVYDAVMPDLKKWGPTDFRRPADDASAVWPQNAVLSLPPVKSR
jgi:hypothetical protein